MYLVVYFQTRIFSRDSQIRHMIGAGVAQAVACALMFYSIGLGENSRCREDMRYGWEAIDGPASPADEVC